LKKLLILIAAVLPNAAAAKVCVPDPSGAAALEWGSGWQVMANTQDAGDFLVSGIARCSTTHGGTKGNKGSPVQTVTDGVNCWCRMVAPRVGAWVFEGNYGTDFDDWCSTCDLLCAGTFYNHATFRANILAPL
jgi:hypothetical protein